MPEQLVISVPTEIHYKKYVEKEFLGSVVLTDPFGAIVYHFLRNQKAERYAPDVLEKFPVMLPLKISAYKLERKYFNPYLSRESVHDLNRIIESFFKRELCRFVDREAKDGIQINDAIQMFMDRYDIVDADISHEALRRAEYRFRKNKRSG